MGRQSTLNRFDPKYASFGPRAPRPRPAPAPAAPPPALATFSPAPQQTDKYVTTPDKYAAVDKYGTIDKYSDKYASTPDKYASTPDKYASTPDKYATVRPPRRAEPQPLSAAALEYRSLQRPRRQQPPTARRRDRDRPDRPDRPERPDRNVPQHDQRDLYAVTEL